jgi:hypothetical protein
MDPNSNWFYQDIIAKSTLNPGLVWTVPEKKKRKPPTKSPERRANPSTVPPSPKRTTELKNK